MVEAQQANTPPCFVFDTSALISIERDPNRRGLYHEMPHSPGAWLVVPSKVKAQLNGAGSPQTTKRWLAEGHTSTFSCDEEGQLYMRLRVSEPLLEDPDIQGIVLAKQRDAVYVVEDGKARQVAQSLGVSCMRAEQFFAIVNPQLL